MTEPTTIPIQYTLKGGDNRPMVIPIWLAEELHKMLEWYLQGKHPPKLICYRVSEEEFTSDFRELIELAKQDKDKAS